MKHSALYRFHDRIAHELAGIENLNTKNLALFIQFYRNIRT